MFGAEIKEQSQSACNEQEFDIPQEEDRHEFEQQQFQSQEERKQHPLSECFEEVSWEQLQNIEPNDICRVLEASEQLYNSPSYQLKQQEQGASPEVPECRHNNEAGSLE